MKGIKKTRGGKEAQRRAIFHFKNAGHNMAIVGEPYNADALAKIPGLFLNILCAFITKPNLCQ